MTEAKETRRMRSERIASTNNGMLLRTRVVQDKKHRYNRNSKKERKAIAEAIAFAVKTPPHFIN